MAGLEDIFNLFEPGSKPTPGAPAETPLLEQPGVRNALLQFGLNAMQPVSAGQTPLGHIASAIGGGAEALDRGAALDRKKELDDAKLGLEGERIDVSRELGNRRIGIAGAGLSERQKQNAIQNALTRERLDLDKEKYGTATDLSKRKLTLSERIFLQKKRQQEQEARMFGVAPPADDSDPGAGLEPGPVEMEGLAPSAPLLPQTKPSVQDFITKYPTDWATIKQRALTGSPAERQNAAAAISRLKGIVSDPQIVDQLLGS